MPGRPADDQLAMHGGPPPPPIGDARRLCCRPGAGGRAPARLGHSDRGRMLPDGSVMAASETDSGTVHILLRAPSPSSAPPPLYGRLRSVGFLRGHDLVTVRFLVEATGRSAHSMAHAPRVRRRLRVPVSLSIHPPAASTRRPQPQHVTDRPPPAQSAIALRFPLWGSVQLAGMGQLLRPDRRNAPVEHPAVLTGGR